MANAISEVFVSLLFKVVGKGDLDRTQISIDKSAASATKLTVGVAAINAAFLGMIDLSMRAGVQLRNFALTTGLSTDELQKWQHAAVVNGVAAEDMTQALKTLQSVRANFDLNNPQNMREWIGILGTDPTQNPFKVLQSLRDRYNASRLKGERAEGIFSDTLANTGLGALLPLIRSTDLEWEKLKQDFIITPEQYKGLAALNAQWADLKFKMTSLSVQLGTVFLPYLTKVGELLEWAADKGVQFVHWLNSGSAGANRMKTFLELLAVGLLALGAIIAGAITAVGALTGAFTLLLALPVVGDMAEIAAGALAVSAAIWGVVAAVEALWTAFSKRWGQFKFSDLNPFSAPGTDQHWALTNGVWRPTPAAGATVHQTNNTTINGVKDAQTIVPDLGRKMRDWNSRAAYQAPNPQTH